MKDININNYEAYLLDLAEGELSPADEKLLMLFLDKHPDIKAEHDLFELEKITADNIYFENKSDLKKTGILTNLTNSNFDELCIAKLEGDINSKEAVEFDKFLRSDELKKKEYDLYKLTQFVPDQKVVFHSKKKLKKNDTKSLVSRRSYSVISVAASIIILVGLYLFMPKQKDNVIIISELDQNKKVEAVKEIIQEKEVAVNNSKVIIEEQKELTEQGLNQIEKQEEIPEAKEEITIEREFERIAMLDPVGINNGIGKINTVRNMIIVNTEDVQNVEVPVDNSMSLKSYLAASFNKRVLKKEDNNKVELFDIAQASVNGINRITGTKMSLERVYRENGTTDRTVFNSKLLAFSTPAKKN